MAYRTGFTPQIAYQKSKSMAARIESRATTIIATWAAGNVDGEGIVSVGQEFKGFYDDLADIKATPGIGQYAKDQEVDQNYDVVAEFNALQSVVQAVCTEIFNSIPKDGTNRLTIYSIGPDCSVTIQSFTPAQTAGIRSKLQDVADQIV